MLLTTVYLQLSHNIIDKFDGERAKKPYSRTRYLLLLLFVPTIQIETVLRHLLFESWKACSNVECGVFRKCTHTLQCLVSAPSSFFLKKQSMDPYASKRTSSCKVEYGLKVALSIFHVFRVFSCSCYHSCIELILHRYEFDPKM